MKDEGGQKTLVPSAYRPIKNFKPAGPKDIIQDYKKLSIDYDVLASLLCIMHDVNLCAFVFGCTVKALEQRVKEDFKKEGFTFYDLQRHYKSGVKSFILQRQLQKAEEGDSRMLIWLGKQYANQSEAGATQVDNAIEMNTVDLWKQAKEIYNRKQSSAVPSGLNKGAKLAQNAKEVLKDVLE